MKREKHRPTNGFGVKKIPSPGSERLGDLS